MEDKYIDRPDLKFKHDLQKNFKDEFFNHISVSKIIAANLTQSYLSFGRKKFKTLNELLKLIYLLFLRDFYYFIKCCLHTGAFPNTKNSILIEAISDQARLREFWLTVADTYKQNECCIITEDFKVYKKFRYKYNVIVPYRFNLTLWVKSRIYIMLNLSPYYKLIYVGDNTHNHFSFKLRVLHDIFHQINSSIKSEYFIRKYNPSCYLTMWDLYPFGAVYCNVFRKFQKPSITFIHGAIGIKSLIEFVPLNADYIISWGKHNTDLLIKSGLDSNKILECGCTRMKAYVGHDNNEIQIDRDIFKINSEKLVICFLNTGIIRKRWLSDMEKLSEIFSNKYELVCRPHPSNDEDYISKHIPTNIKILSDKNISLERTIAISDYFISDSSSAGFDALFMKKIVFLLDSNEVDVYQDIMYDAYKSGAVLFSKSVRDFLSQFEKVTNNIGYKKKILKNQDSFIDDYVTFYSQESALNIKKSINNIISLS
ncbi:CDP-glycerol glycerophosphotransferase family protein [Akkermansiaceae bacterium]|nr:CDP-glycerol glycerophosphotransferase family protein [Akkermansiaceae bacterium]